MCQPNVQQNSVGCRLAMLFRKPLEKSHQPFGNGQVSEVFSDRECLVPLLVKIFRDIHGEARKTRQQPVHVLGSRHAEQRFRHAYRDGRSLDRRKNDFLTEQTAGAEDRYGDVLAVGRTPGDTDGSAFDEINETRFITLLKKNVAFLTGLLHEKPFAIRDRFVAGAIEKTRLLQIPNLIFGCGLFCRSRASR